MLALVYHFAPASNSASIRNTKILKYLPGCAVRLELITVRPQGSASTPNDDLLAQLPPSLGIVRTRCVFPQEALIRLKHRIWGRVGERASSTDAPDRDAGTRTGVSKSRWQELKDVLTYSLTVPDKYVGWYPFAVWAGFRRLRRTSSDVIYAVGQPWTAFLVALTLKSLSGKPLVLDFMDPWASRAESWDEHKPAYLSRVAAVLERFVVRRADFVVANTEELADDLTTRLGLPPDRVRVVTCGFDPPDFRNLTARRDDNALVLTHTGSCYGKRNPANLLRAVKSLLEAERIPRGMIRVNFIGSLNVTDGDLQQLLADPLVSAHVRIEPWLPHSAALERLSQSDVLVLLQPELRLAVPAKLYEYAAVGRPILALADLDGAVARVIERERLGVTVRNDDLGGITREVERLFMEFKDGRLAARYSPGDLSDYHVENLARKLAGILHEACSRPLGRAELVPR